MLGLPSPTAVRWLGRLGVPAMGLLAAALLTTQGASAATLTPGHHQPPPPAKCAVRVPGGKLPGTVTKSGSGSAVTSAKSGSGQVIVKVPGRPPVGIGPCVVCGGVAVAQPAPGRIQPLDRSPRCLVCVVSIHRGGGPVPGPVTTGSGPVKVGSGTGSVKVTSSGGSGTVSVPSGGGTPMCPPPPPLTRSGSTR
jgi:hypothetical protein